MEQNSLLQTLFYNKSDNFLIQLFRYTFVGGVAYICDFSVLWFLTDIVGIHYLLSASFGFLVGLTVNYILSIKWVFSNRVIKDKKMEVVFFAIIGVVGLGLTELFMWVFTDLILFHYLLSKVFSTVITYAWNFLARKFLLFK